MLLDCVTAIRLASQRTDGNVSGKRRTGGKATPNSLSTTGQAITLLNHVKTKRPWMQNLALSSLSGLPLIASLTQGEKALPSVADFPVYTIRRPRPHAPLSALLSSPGAPLYTALVALSPTEHESALPTELSATSTSTSPPSSLPLASLAPPLSARHCPGPLPRARNARAPLRGDPQPLLALPAHLTKPPAWM
ncbi:hypothetical protein BV25DRAFT_1911955 [Artomyces pyxidatus]|uniref:Uncharacterized protein n=2 Tax=Artomyces pyxidatus TaxID=48021 RepID=A0ACB8SHW4_9AGAM|nr:hypothetical protein BV25DRAFT_1921270 [Artomyces pyxidatus]KAI0067303.1 hypothetical protein BV25DRAFT_1911955 [Artomyces pyxidatus]